MGNIYEMKYFKISQYFSICDLYMLFEAFHGSGYEPENEPQPNTVDEIIISGNFISDDENTVEIARTKRGRPKPQQ